VSGVLQLVEPEERFNFKPRAEGKCVNTRYVLAAATRDV